METEPFLILGLPRSRTAWLATFLTHGPSFCHHDGLAYCKSSIDVARIFRGAPFVGNSDAGQAHFFSEIVSILPMLPPVVVVRRDPAEVFHSCQQLKAEVSKSGLLYLGRILDQITAEYPLAMEVDFEDLNSLGTLQRIWHHCTGSQEPFDAERATQLMGMNVQVSKAHLKKTLKLAEENIPHLVRNFEVMNQTCG